MTDMTAAARFAAPRSAAGRLDAVVRRAWSGLLDWHRRRIHRANVALSALDHRGLADVGLERSQTVPTALAGVRDASHWPRW